MSQIIKSEKISKRGKGIEEYLNSIYSESWFPKTKKLKNMKGVNQIFIHTVINKWKNPIENQDTMESEENALHVK